MTTTTTQPVTLEKFLKQLKTKLVGEYIHTGSDDRELAIDLRSLLDRVYERAGYEVVLDYNRDPVPQLEERSTRWMKGLLQHKVLSEAKGMRIYESLVSHEQTHDIKERSRRRSHLKRTAIYQASNRGRIGEGINLQRDGNGTPVYSKNLSRLPT